MRFKALLSICIIASFSISCDKEDNNEVIGCINEYATNYDSKATKDCGCCEFKQADVVFWADSTFFSGLCDSVSVVLTNNQTGQETTEIGVLEMEPANCDNTLKGYVRVNVGSYTYKYSDGVCITHTASVTVVEGCNKFKLN